jgi:CubicO group peptidase (beta-lactamase class C family)
MEHPMNPRVDAVLRMAVDTGAVPHVVAVAADDTGVIYEGAAGPVGADSTFRIASMTKLVCTVAALQQRDGGTLDFDAPVDTYCPDFADLQVLVGFDDDGPRTRPPASRATVRQLVTHTAGFAYAFWNAKLARWSAANPAGSLFTVPMVADPGATFEYGISTDWLGRVIEAASGTPLDEHLAKHIFTPLGMNSTTFQLTDEQRAHCVPVHVRDENGTWVTTDFDWNQDPEHWPGGHGLYSTPRDYLTFQRMLLAGGQLQGTTILAAESVREAFTNQIGELWFPPVIPTADPATSCDFVAGPGMKWGWGLLLNTGDLSGRRWAGSGAWAGLFNTFFWIDPSARLAGAVYTQTSPFVVPPALQVYGDVERELYATRAIR